MSSALRPLDQVSRSCDPSAREVSPARVQRSVVDQSCYPGVIDGPEHEELGVGLAGGRIGFDSQHQRSASEPNLGRQNVFSAAQNTLELIIGGELDHAALILDVRPYPGRTWYPPASNLLAGLWSDLCQPPAMRAALALAVVLACPGRRDQSFRFRGGARRSRPKLLQGSNGSGFSPAISPAGLH